MPTSPLICAVLLAAPSLSFAEPALTIYNQNFAVVRDMLALELKTGVNTVTLTDTTAHLEPDSVMLAVGSARTF